MKISITRLSYPNPISDDDKNRVKNIKVTDEPVHIDINRKITKNRDQYIKAIIDNKKKIKIIFDLPDVLYHETYLPNIDILKPSTRDPQKKIEGKALYATPHLWYAIVFSKRDYVKTKHKSGLSVFLDFGFKNNKGYIVENQIGALNELFSDKAYVYVIDSKNFLPFRRGTLGAEFYTTKEKIPLKIMTINNPKKVLYDELGDDNIFELDIKNRKKDMFYLIKGKEYRFYNKNMKLISQIDKKKDKFIAISEFIKKLSKKKYQKDIFRKRNANEIVQSGYSTGCSDNATIAMAILRYLGYPTKFVETVQKTWLHENIEKLDDVDFHGHVFLDVLYKGKWKVYDPIYGFTPDNKYTLHGKEYVVLAKGIDHTLLIDDHNNTFISAKTLEDIKKLAKEYVEH